MILGNTKQQTQTRHRSLSSTREICHSVLEDRNGNQGLDVRVGVEALWDVGKGEEAVRHNKRQQQLNFHHVRRLGCSRSPLDFCNMDTPQRKVAVITGASSGTFDMCLALLTN